MVEVATKPLQLGFDGEFAKTNGSKPVSQLPPSPEHPVQSSLEDETIRREIPNLRLINRGVRIMMQTPRGFIAVFAGGIRKENQDNNGSDEEKGIILQRVASIYGRRKRWRYSTRASTTEVRPVDNQDEVIAVARGSTVDTFGREVRISKKREAGVIQELRPPTKTV